jgi:DNA-binding beta-propeller fold protein YncE
MKGGLGLGIAAAALLAVGGTYSATTTETTPTGALITPSAAPGSIFQSLHPDLPGDPAFTAGQASALALSPDGHTLLILTSGFNRIFGPDGKFIVDRSQEYVFVYDVAGANPVKRQVLTVPDTFLGIAWSPRGDRFFVSGGVDDDVVEFVGAPGAIQAGRTFRLGHKAGLGLTVKPEAAGLAVSPDGRRLLVANFQNDSITVIDLGTGALRETDLRPGAADRTKAGRPGGTFPQAVAWTGDAKAYVASERDRQVIALSVRGPAPRVTARISTRGQPTALASNGRGRLYVALDNTDAVGVVDIRSDRLIETIPTAGPKDWGPRGLGGAGSNALALSPDGQSLLVSDGGLNALAVIRLDDRARGSKGPSGRADDDDRPQGSAVVGMIPTGWYPTAVAVRPDGRRIFVVNGKSNAGPNPRACRNDLAIVPAHDFSCRASNQYVWQREKAGFLTLPPPSPAALGALTRRAAANNHIASAPSAREAEIMAFLRGHIRHVIYVVKENRTYDQILGDLEVGDGDPRLAVFPDAMTPNQHQLARQFVDLDRFFDSGESSNTGWNWTVAGRTNDFTEREAPVNYASRGLQYDQEGDNRNLNMGLASSAERRAADPLAPSDPNILPGAVDVAAPDGPGGEAGKGYLWDQALRVGLTVRNWGFYGDLTLYDEGAGPYRTPKLHEPWKVGIRVFVPAKASLMAISDPYFRGFDQGFPDYWRFREWAREFDGFAASGVAPNLMLVRMPHDHTGDFGEGIDGINTVEGELADNDYAVGLLVEKVAHSRFAKDTLIFVVEDDAQDGPDHVDAHRSVAFIAGPFVKQGAVISHRYATTNLVRTIEEVLGLPPIGLPDAAAEPMTDVFDTALASWTFDARVPKVLRTTTLPLPPSTDAERGCIAPLRSAAYWTAAMKGQDFSREDHLDTAAYNLELWRGLRGDAPYPAARDGRDLRKDRAGLLARYPSRCG